MASFNRVILLGNLTRDPEVRYLPSGMAVCEFTLAMSETYTSKSGEKVESACFVDVVVWARQAETCGQYLGKGSSAMVEGRLQLDKWKTKEGENRSKLRVRADRVQFLGRPKGGAEVSDTSGGGAVEAQPPPEDEMPPDAEPRGAGRADEDNLPF
jgi:single-strand DNA-binding protein